MRLRFLHILSFAFLGLLTPLGCEQDDRGGMAPVPDVEPFVPEGGRTFYRGADLSFLPQMEQDGVIYRQNGEERPSMKLFKDLGVNLVRVRLWHSPAGTHSGLEEVLALARDIQAQGIGLYLDFHYSDTWADPGTQDPPSAWSGLSLNDLESAIYAYTRDVMQALAAQGTLPEVVQVGNEINGGMLWDKARVGGAFDGNWPVLAAYLKAGIRAINEIDPDIKTMIHHAGLHGATEFFQRLEEEEVDFDLIGLSYYPWWHGSNLDAFGAELREFSSLFHQPILICETAYPWTLDWADWTNNLVGDVAQLSSGYPASPEGQEQFLTDLRTIVEELDDHKGMGICYWAPDWVASRGDQATDGSAWENLALFDFDWQSLPAWKAFQD